MTAPESVPAGSTFTVEWTGPNSRRDYLTIVPQGADAGEYLDYAYTVEGTSIGLAPTSVTIRDRCTTPKGGSW